MKCFQKYIPQKETPMDMRLDITFHDPNTPEDTYKMVTKVFSEGETADRRYEKRKRTGFERPANRYIIVADLSI